MPPGGSIRATQPDRAVRCNPRGASALEQRDAVRADRGLALGLGAVEHRAPAAAGERHGRAGPRRRGRPPRRRPRRRARTRTTPARRRAARTRPRTRPGAARAAPARARSGTACASRRSARRPPRSASSSVAAPRPVDRPAVVGVDEREGEQLVALVDVGHARDGQLEQQLAERGAVAGRGHARRRTARSRRGTAGARAAPRAKRLTAASCASSGLDPVRRALGLAQRLLDVGLQPLAVDRPGADERLEEEVALDAVGPTAPSSGSSARASAARAPPTRPASRRAPRCRARTSPERLVSWVWVTSRLRGKRARALGVGRVEAVDASPKRARVAADVVERQQPRVAVERGVLDALGHHRRRRLLEARDELARRRLAASALGQPRPSRQRRLAVLGGAGPSTARRRCGRPAARRAPPRRPRHVGAAARRRSTSRANVPRACSSLASSAPVGERPRVARQLVPQRGQRRLAGGVDEQRRRRR